MAISDAAPPSWGRLADRAFPLRSAQLSRKEPATDEPPSSADVHQSAQQNTRDVRGDATCSASGTCSETAEEVFRSAPPNQAASDQQPLAIAGAWTATTSASTTLAWLLRCAACPTSRWAADLADCTHQRMRSHSRPALATSAYRHACVVRQYAMSAGSAIGLVRNARWDERFSARPCLGHACALLMSSAAGTFPQDLRLDGCHRVDGRGLAGLPGSCPGLRRLVLKRMSGLCSMAVGSLSRLQVRPDAHSSADLCNLLAAPPSPAGCMCGAEIGLHCFPIAASHRWCSSG